MSRKRINHAIRQVLVKPSEEITPTKSSKTKAYLSDKPWFKAVGAALLALQIEAWADIAWGKSFSYQVNIEYFLVLWGIIIYGLILVFGGRWVKKMYAKI